MWDFGCDGGPNQIGSANMDFQGSNQIEPRSNGWNIKLSLLDLSLDFDLVNWSKAQNFFFFSFFSFFVAHPSSFSFSFSFFSAHFLCVAHFFSPFWSVAFFLFCRAFLLVHLFIISASLAVCFSSSLSFLFSRARHLSSVSFTSSFSPFSSRRSSSRLWFSEQRGSRWQRIGSLAARHHGGAADQSNGEGMAQRRSRDHGWSWVGARRVARGRRRWNWRYGGGLREIMARRWRRGGSVLMRIDRFAGSQWWY